MKRTKVVATIGPASDNPEMIKKLIQEGVNVFRFNFKHNTVEWHTERIHLVNEVTKEMGVAVGTLLDLQGPEIRIKMPGSELILIEGELLVFDQRVFDTKEKGFSISHPQIIPHLTHGQHLLADDGTLAFDVEVKDNVRYLRVLQNGLLKANKSLNIPGADFPFPVLTERDYEGLDLAKKGEVDYIALSFVRSAADVSFLQAELKKREIFAHVIAKIETKKALDDIEAIVGMSNGIMIARGDLGVELPMEQVPFHQKQIIRLCIKKGIPVITATQMLQSMIENSYPTRAEISDVANAVYDFTDAVMLSGETASGRYPDKAVSFMARTAQFTEENNRVDVRRMFDLDLSDQEQRICNAAYSLYYDSKTTNEVIAGFIVFSESGRTARLIARYRPSVPIYLFASRKTVADKANLYFGVIPFIQSEVHEHSKEVTGDDIQQSIEYLVQKGLLKKNSRYIVTHGDKWAVVGGTSTIKIVAI